MISFISPLLFVLLLVLNTSGCDLVGGLVKFNLWTVLIIVAVVALLAYGLIKGIFG